MYIQVIVKNNLLEKIRKEKKEEKTEKNNATAQIRD
jgi:hypothetical protein